VNTAAIDSVARALLYEGYLLYPYRPSAVKNRHRFNFGVLYPKAYSEAQENTEAWFAQTECLVVANSLTAIEVKARFLHLTERSIEESIHPPAGNRSQAERRAVERIEVDGHVFRPWQEAVEREIALPVCNLQSLTRHPVDWPVAIPGTRVADNICDKDSNTVGAILRTQEPIDISIEVSSQALSESVYKLTIRVRNLTVLADLPANREQALLRSPVSTHALLGVRDGEFVSLLDPPEHLLSLVASCNNIGMFPVLIGDQAHNNTLLSSPIILYDYPQVASESAGDLFDSTEIDEILSLRIMTLTEEEKCEARNSDERARRILERTDNLPEEQLLKLHGALRGLQALQKQDERR
jgi:hypothetical protein